MGSSAQESILFEIRNLHTDFVRFSESILANVRGIYRRAGKAPVQPPLPGLVADDSPMPAPGAIARSLPRKWSNTVRAWEALWDQACGAIPFETAELYKPAVLDAVAERTSRRLKPQTLARMMLALLRAGAAVHPDGRRGVWKLVHPTDALREAVEREAGRMNERRPARREPSDLRTFEPSNRPEAPHA